MSILATNSAELLIHTKPSLAWITGARQIACITRLTVQKTSALVQPPAKPSGIMKDAKAPTFTVSITASRPTDPTAPLIDANVLRKTTNIANKYENY